MSGIIGSLVGNPAAAPVTPASLGLPSSYLGQVATRCVLCTNSIVGSSATVDSGRKIHFIHENNFSQLTVVFSNFSVSTGNVETGIASGSVKCSVENLATGAITQAIATVSFVNGYAACVVNFSSPQPRGFYGVRWYRQSPNGLAYEGYPTSRGTHPLDGWIYNLTSVTDYTQGGTPPQAYLRSQGYGPILILAQTINPSIIMFGTSRPFGQYDYVSDATADIGYSRIFGRRFAYTNLSIGSSQLQTLLSQSRTFRDQICNGSINGVVTGSPYHSHMSMEHVVNDVQTGGRTVAQVLADRATWAALWPKHTRIGMTSTPTTPSTDLWLTLAGQATTGTVAVKLSQVNDGIRAGIAGEDILFDTADLVDPYRSLKMPVTRDPDGSTAGGASVTASFSGYVMTVSAVGSGAVSAGAVVHGSGLATNTQILPYGTEGTTGTGGAGTYATSTSQTVASSAFTCDGLATGDGLHETTVLLGLMRDRGAPLLSLIRR